MATHSSTLGWKIPWMEKHGRLQSMGSQRVEHYWATSLSLSNKHLTGGAWKATLFSDTIAFLVYLLLLDSRQFTWMDVVNMILEYFPPKSWNLEMLNEYLFNLLIKFKFIIYLEWLFIGKKILIFLITFAFLDLLGLLYRKNSYSMLCV